MAGQTRHPTCTDCIKSGLLLMKRLVLVLFIQQFNFFILIIDFPHIDSIFIFKFPHSFCGLRSGPLKHMLRLCQPHELSGKWPP